MSLIYLFIYLLYYNLNLDSAGSARINVKEREKKGREVRRAKKRKRIEAQGAKLSTPSQANDALMGEEEKNNRKKQGAGPLN